LNVNVYIANSLTGTATDRDGIYKITNLPGGKYSLIVSIIGYYHKLKSISIDAGENIKIDFSLSQRTYELPTVHIIDEEDDEWKDNYRTFVREFIGQTENADDVEIDNPYLINFSRNAKGNLVASVSEPLEITNSALGYKILYFLNNFEYDDVGSVKYSGYPIFREMTPGDPGDKEDWEETRYETYLGSFRHFMEAISLRFNMKDSTYSNYTGSETLLENTAGNFATVLYAKPPWETGAHDYRIAVDIINYMSKGNQPNELKLSFDEYLYVNYKKSYSKKPESTLKLHADTVTIDINGRYHDEYKIQRFGYWATQRLADMLPLDYNPPKEK
jgi:hypothetical protein